MINRKNKHMFSERYKFTLIELLVVMLIMGVLAAVLIPSFSGLDRNYNLLQAGQDIGGQIAIARSYAMANHCTMALVFLQKKDLDKLPDYQNKKESILSKNYNRLCRIAHVVKNNDGFYEFVMWKPDSQWVSLPRNTYIASGEDEFNEMPKSLKNVRIGDFLRDYKPLPDEDEMKVTADIDRYIVFNSDGQLVIDGNTVTPKGSAAGENVSKVIRIRITEGGYNLQENGFIQLSRTKGIVFYQYVEIDPLTGRIEYSTHNN